MTRSAQILQGITKEMRGIEIAPWFAPIAPKREGFNCLALDVFDRETLLQRAKDDPNIPGVDLLETVDIVGSATEIADLIPEKEHGTFDYIVSSHNFEHLPNPIKFLQGVEKILKPGGVLSMAVPDKRACFDFFRPLSTIVNWLSAYRDDRSKPTNEQLFEYHAFMSVLSKDGNESRAFSIHDDLDRVHVSGDLRPAYDIWRQTPKTDEYRDAHCSVMTPSSFILLINECRFLGLTSMEIESVSEPAGCEFYVRLINRTERRLQAIFPS